MNIIEGDLDITIKNETFIEISTGNLSDSIHNNVSNLQDYANMLEFNINNIYKGIKKSDNKDSVVVAKMVAMEMDNIVKMRLVKFCINNVKLIERKYNYLYDNIVSNTNKNNIYSFSEFFYNKLNDLQDSINFEDLGYYSYDKRNNHKDTYQFKKYTDDILEKYDNIKIKDNIIDFFRDEYLIILNAIFIKLITTLVQLKNIAEYSDTLITLSKIVKIEIELLVLLYELDKSLTMR